MRALTETHCGVFLFLLSLLLVFAADVAQVTLLQADHEVTIARDSSPQDALYYFKIDETKNANVKFVQAIIQSCKGLINIYVKRCTETSCDDDKYLPSPTSFDAERLVIEAHRPQHAIDNVLCASEVKACTSQGTVYYVAIQAFSANAPMEFTIRLKTFTDAEMPAMYTMSLNLGYNSDIQKVSWETLAKCTKTSTNHEQCIQSATVEDAVYSLYYVLYDPTLPVAYNLGTVCGMVQYGNISIAINTDTTGKTKDLYTYLSVPANGTYMVNVVAQSKSQPSIYTSYRGMVVSASSGKAQPKHFDDAFDIVSVAVILVLSALILATVLAYRIAKCFLAPAIGIRSGYRRVIEEFN